MKDLSARLVAGLRADPDVTRGYARDQTDLQPAGTPCAVAAPVNVQEVQDVMRWATERGVAVVPRGAGTGLSGAACVPDGALVLSTERLTAVREISTEDRYAVAEAGVVNAHLNAQLSTHGLMFAPDPSSWQTSTIGGNVATNAGGLRCVRYGTTRQSVLELEAVLADGRVLRTGGRTVKRSAGYDLTQLLCGSEGTLAVITAATVRLHPLPPAQLTTLATFASASSAAAAATALVTGPAVPTLLELLDDVTVRALDDYRHTGFGPDVAALLLVQVDAEPGRDRVLAETLAEQGALEVMTTDDEAEAQQLLDIRRSAHPALQRLGTVLVEDVAVPRSRLADLLDRLAEVRADSGLTIACAAHAGDGNAHPLLVLDDGPDAEERAWAAADRIFHAARELGGTLSGEHGVGRLKRRWLADELGEVAIDTHLAIKRALDPQGLLNPGALVG